MFASARLLADVQREAMVIETTPSMIYNRLTADVRHGGHNADQIPTLGQVKSAFYNAKKSQTLADCQLESLQIIGEYEVN